MDVLIVGAGAMGTWVADVVGDAATISFSDIDTDAATAAARRYDGGVSPPDADETFDVVFLAVPMSAVVWAVNRYGPRADRAVVDLSGTMSAPVDAMRTTAPELERISLHPLFAPENAPGNIPAVIENGGPVTRWLRELLGDAGCTIVETTVEEHDEAMETIQAKAHAALLAYALVAEPVPDGFRTPISSGLEALLGDLLHGTPRVYAEIQGTFPGARELAEAADRIAGADPEEFEALYREATNRHDEREHAGH